MVENDLAPFIAHISADGNRIQTVSEHLKAVQTGCESYGSKIDVSYLSGLAGLLHDLGKNTTAFKTYIQEAVAHPDNPPRRGSVDHSTAGGRFLYRRYHQKATTHLEKLTAEWIANCIISHHQGLRDYLDVNLHSPFLERVALKRDGMEEYEEAEATFLAEWSADELDRYFAEAQQEVARILDTVRSHMLSPIASSLLIKYIFSCLIDADRTNTRQFEEDQWEPWTSDHRDFFVRSYAKVMEELQSYEKSEDAEHPINQLRREMSQQCEDFAERSSGIYTLSIPTGGGKTLSSLRYALKHALLHGKERVVYIVPYTTIIEQNADKIRKILQADDMLLEHHSNVFEETEVGEDDYDLLQKRLGMARDNWDRPLIFTTMVQFLNTFYAKGTRNVRRLHRLSNAVLIFDEVQTVPPRCVSLFNEALNFLNIFGHSTSILCTATQPTLDFVKHKLKIAQQAEIIRDLGEASRQFKRVEIEDMTSLSIDVMKLVEFIRDRIKEENRILVILNTKSAVRKLFRQLEEELWVKDNEVKLFHLSTNMCAAHRRKVLEKTREALAAKESVICVSTQLIEAGVDISFDCVIRSLAGLDSIAQAAGRCNRHGFDPVKKIYVIQSADEVLKSLPEIRIGSEETQRVLRDFAQDPDRFGNDLLSSKAMSTYFKYYFNRIQEDLNYWIPELGRNLFDLLDKNTSLYEGFSHKHGRFPEILSRASFATAERYFQVIRDSTTSMLVPYDEDAKDLLQRLNGDLDSENFSKLLRKSQQYIVNLYDQDVRSLDRNGGIYGLLHGNILALRESAYSEHFGVEPGVDGGWEPEFA